MTARPDFFFVGTMKAATTALHRRLREHPEVFMPAAKEPYYFSDRTGPGLPTRLDDYLAWFIPALPGQRVGEASPGYLHDPSSAERIHAFAPDARILVSLRQPVERAHSHYLMMLSRGAVPLGDFEHLLTRSHAAARAGAPPDEATGYAQSWYADALERYLDRFPRDRVLVVTHDAFRADPDVVLARIFQFLDVDDTVRIREARRGENVGVGPPRHRALHRAVFGDHLAKRLVRRVTSQALRDRIARHVRHRNRTPKPDLPLDVRRRLTRMFDADIERTAALSGLDLGHWTSAGLR